jgi:mediator of RNA polymerase II transcription subunit 14
VFSPTGVVTLVTDGSFSPGSDLQADFIPLIADILALRVHLCADEVVIITIDSRTGRLNLRDTGDLAAAGRGPRFTAISEKLNENPTILFEALVRLRLHVRFCLSLLLWY